MKQLCHNDSHSVYIWCTSNKRSTSHVLSKPLNHLKVLKQYFSLKHQHINVQLFFMFCVNIVLIYKHTIHHIQSLKISIVSSIQLGASVYTLE